MAYEDDLINLQRQQMLAQMLQQQGSQGMQPQMVNGRYVAPSPFANILGALQQVGGTGLAAKNMQSQIDLTKQRRMQIVQALQSMAGAPGNQSAMPAMPAVSDTGASTPSSSGDPLGVNAPSNSTPTGAPAFPVPRNQKIAAALSVIGGMPIEQQEKLLAEQASKQAFPEGFTLSPEQTRFGGRGEVIASLPRKVEKPTTDIQDFEYAKKQGFKGNLFDWMQAKKQPPINVNVNTEKSLYGQMADARAKAIDDLYNQAQKAPDLINRARRVKSLLGPDSQAMTGAGADWMLTGAKIANQLGINTGSSTSDTEMLARELASSTLDAIKSSGLGGGTGFSNADRDFLEKAVGGKITLEANTLKRLSDLNEKAGMNTIKRWNDTASKLKPEELKTLGMGQLEAPAAASAPKLQKNPDGSYTYSP